MGLLRFTTPLIVRVLITLLISSRPVLVTQQTDNRRSDTSPGEQASSATESGKLRSQNQIRVYTQEVVLPVTVTDKDGELALDLAQNDFRVYDNGEEQPITHWDLDGEPLAVAVVIETSSHIAILMWRMIETGGCDLGRAQFR
jgi:hypothetical protein